MERLLSKKAVKDAIGFSFAHIARMEAADQFPKRVPVGGRVFWVQSEVADWIQSKIALRDATTGS